MLGDCERGSFVVTTTEHANLSLHIMLYPVIYEISFYKFIIIPARSIYAAVQSFILLQSSQATDWVAWHYNSEYELSLFANIFP